MLKYLKIRNFHSVYDELKLDFNAHQYGSKKENLFHIGNDTLAKSIVMYGANGSWKTTILKAMWVIWHFTVRSAIQGPLKPVPFMFNASGKTEASFFEIGFYLKNHEYVYSFSLKEEKVITESLILLKAWKRVHLFQREGNRITSSDSTFISEIVKGEGRMLETASLISVLSQWNGQLEWMPIGHFFSKINIIMQGELEQGTTLEFLKNNIKGKQMLIDLLKCADISIDDIKVSEVNIPEAVLNQIRSSMPGSLPVPTFATRIEIGHKNENHEIEYLDLATESKGTIRLFQLFGYIVKTIVGEEMLFVDEIETNLHPHILKNLFDLIHNFPERKYQFTFTTHNFDILDLEIFRKEQIKIIDKKIDGTSKISSLFDYSGLRTGLDVRKMFNQGDFGGIPKNIQDFAEIIRRYYWEQGSELNN